MKNRLFSKTNLFLISLFSLSCYLPLDAGKAPKDKISEWIDSCPYIGLVADEVTFGPITLRDLDLDDCGKVIVVKPDEEFDASVKYKIDSDELDSLKMHHLIIGIKGEDAQFCITHTLGILDKKGKAKFSIKAPSGQGVYELRFDYQKALTCEEAQSNWRLDPPSSKGVVGIIIVE